MDQDRMERDDDVEMETDTETDAERRTAEVAELERADASMCSGCSV